MPDASAADLLRRASEAPPNSMQRRLLTAAAFATAGLEGAVLVGGAAAEIHTGWYRPTDIDLVGHRKSNQSRSLGELGFEKHGRHWVLSFDDEETLAIEVPGDSLGDFATEPPQVIDLAPGELAVISLNDLMIDRLLQATGGEPVTFDEAVRLGVAAYERIDWPKLEERAGQAVAAMSFAGKALPEVLSRVRREAIRLLRA
ncbi:MAG: hypothetical protein KJ698_11845 [Actinobacteria bacterium]|nr:hypothetical protein [Actinomycetota bacterium]